MLVAIMTSKKLRNILTIAAGILLALVASGVMYWGLFFSPTRFDRQTWLDGEKIDFPKTAPRLRMADALVRDAKLIGMTHGEVDALLGPQTDTHLMRSAYEYVYWLGPERGFFGIDSEWLVLNFDENGKVREALIARD
jgi:hypothetical protein